MSDEALPEWRIKAREWAERNAAAKARPADVEHDADLIPEPEYEVDPVDAEVDRLVDQVDILDAYARWCGKMTPEPNGKRESIMISCPRPDHPDKVPSAWINLDSQVWFCGGCQEGGDALDIAAWHFGYDVPGYKTGKSFPDLRRRIAEEFGLIVRTTPGGQRYTQEVVIEPPPVSSEPDKDSKNPSSPGPPPTFSVPLAVFSTPGPDSDGDVVPIDGNLSTGGDGFSIPREESGISEPDPGAGGPAPVEPEPEATITDISTLVVTPEELITPPSIPWRELVREEGFLGEWMGATSHDDLPEEYYFLLGLMALGLAAGRDVTLGDQPEVRGNLYVCLLGGSGMGKSRSIGVFQRLLGEALPYDESDPVCRGTSFMSPGSAEALIDGFSKPIIDPSDPKVVMGHSPVRGLIRFDELSTLVGRSVRTGSVLKPTLMEFYDGYGEIVHRTRGMGMIRAVEHFATSVTTSQPKVIRNLLTTDDADSGFLNRWIFAMGPEKKQSSFGGYSFSIDRAVLELRRTQTWAATTPLALLPTADALHAWDEHFHNVLMPLKKGIDPDALLARIDLTMKKIMLLLAIDRRHTAIELEDVEDALKMWDYLLQSYGFVSGQIGFGPFEEIHKAVKDTMTFWANAGRHLVSIREINKALWRRKFAIDMLGRVVQAMVLVGELEEEVTKPARGPTVVKYRYME